MGLFRTDPAMAISARSLMWIPAETTAMTVKTAVSIGWVSHSVRRNAPLMT